MVWVAVAEPTSVGVQVWVRAMLRVGPVPVCVQARVEVKVLAHDRERESDPERVNEAVGWKVSDPV